MLILTVVTSLFVFAIVYVALALILIATQRLKSPDQLQNNGPFEFDPSEPRYQEPSQPLAFYKGADDTRLGYRHYVCNRTNAPLLVFCHGSTNHSGMYEPLAKMIVNARIADVVLPDMRGHGSLFGPSERGIAHYVPQLEDDTARLIQETAKPGQRVIIGGHSLGGGFAIRFSTGAHRQLIDGAFLVSPYLNTRAPTNRPYAGGFIRVMYRRALGLTMLGVPKLFGLHRLPVVQFNLSQEYRNFERSWLSTDRYNYAATMGFGPRQRWAKDVANLPRFALVIGDKDETFFADQYEPTMSALTDQGDYHILPGVDHVHASMDQRTVDAFEAFAARC